MVQSFLDSTICFRVSALVIKGCLSSKKSKAILHNQTLLPDCLMLVCFLSLLLPDLSHYLALVQKHPSPSGHLLGILLVCCLSVLEFLQDSYLDTLQPLPFLPLPRVPFMSPSTGSVINPAKSRTTSGHSILQWEWIVLSSMAFRAFTKQWPLQ